MSRISRSSLVMFSAEQMYNLVSDVESYPEFLPGCAGGAILKQDGDWIEASLEISKGGLRHTFTTRNRLVEGKSIEMELLEGPFKSLTGVWVFQALGDQGCKISLDLTFEMSNRLAQMTVEPIFVQMTNKMVDAFAQRAKQIYG